MSENDKALVERLRQAATFGGELGTFHCPPDLTARIIEALTAAKDAESKATIKCWTHEIREPGCAKCQGETAHPPSPPTADVADKDRIAALEAALRDLIQYADLMPKKTPAAGSCVTEHSFTISAGAIWGLDLCVQRASATLEKPDGE